MQCHLKESNRTILCHLLKRPEKQSAVRSAISQKSPRKWAKVSKAVLLNKENKMIAKHTGTSKSSVARETSKESRKSVRNDPMLYQWSGLKKNNDFFFVDYNTRVYSQKKEISSRCRHDQKSLQKV